MLKTNGPLELTAHPWFTADGAAIRVAPPDAGAAQWADIWVTAEELIGWLKNIDDARKRESREREGVAHLLALKRQTDGLPRPEPEADEDRLCQDCGHAEHAGECLNRYCLCRHTAISHEELT
jgi:hypothetical protein